MSALAVTGWGVLSAIGSGAEEFSEAWGERRSGRTDVTGMFEQQLPSATACAIPGFDAKEYLGKKGTRFFDRSTALSVVACKLALDDARLARGEEADGGIGLVLGLSSGGPQAMSDFIHEMYTSEKPYLVNPLLFPYAVMNGAASATAIWHKLKGVNATVSGGQMAFLTALRYARNKVRNGYVHAAVTGVVEEFSPTRAWASHQARGTAEGRVELGEGGAFFVLEDAEAVRTAGRSLDAEILAVDGGLYGEPGSEDDPAAGLAECITRALEAAGVAAADVWAVAPSLSGSPRRDAIELAAVRTALGTGTPNLLPVKELVGETYSAAGGLQLAALLAEHRNNPARDGAVSLVTSLTSEGMAGVAVVRGWSRATSA
ncbi:beta-ketoacyl synthase N-terminal-like domain-containing protein [Kitasatospora sp. NPDC056181]|uniref:beta-ketoacyl synthase N-terminal-like domain-containing protein n=1 Tax=Kitasatospora sp. NPDC056181 TaxID=3345737 RepID=UPI0035D981AB